MWWVCWPPSRSSGVTSVDARNSHRSHAPNARNSVVSERARRAGCDSQPHTRRGRAQPLVSAQQAAQRKEHLNGDRKRDLHGLHARAPPRLIPLPPQPSSELLLSVGELSEALSVAAHGSVTTLF